MFFFCVSLVLRSDKNSEIIAANMKKILLLLLAAAVMSQRSASAWNRFGHEVVIKVAERHLTERARAQIARYMPYDLKTDAVWMDNHRMDREIAYTTAWHVYHVDENHDYDPNPRLKQGDILTGMRTADYNLGRYGRLADSAVVMNLRMLLHFVGDMHCPTHSYFPGPRCFWPCTLNGKPQQAFHYVYDRMPELLFGEVAAEDIAARIDDLDEATIRMIQQGTFLDWIRDCGDRNCVIYKWNPFNCEVLDPNTVELSRELVTVQLRNAGYRLALLLNRYFDR